MEEEVDWGMDESVDVDEWRRGGSGDGDEDVMDAVDEDVISLNGVEEEGKPSRRYSYQ